MGKRLEDWQNLELERYDTSYRRFKPKPPPSVKHVCQPKIVQKVVVREIISEKMKKLYFDAGRFRAGDRDKSALEAIRQLEQLGEL